MTHYKESHLGCPECRRCRRHLVRPHREREQILWVQSPQTRTPGGGPPPRRSHCRTVRLRPAYSTVTSVPIGSMPNTTCAFEMGSSTQPLLCGQP